MDEKASDKADEKTAGEVTHEGEVKEEHAVKDKNEVKDEHAVKAKSSVKDKSKGKGQNKVKDKNDIKNRKTIEAIPEIIDQSKARVDADPVPALAGPESIPESMGASEAEPASEGVPEPTRESLPESVSESVPESVSESVRESVPESVRESLPESVSESVPESVSEFVLETLPQPVGELAAEPVTMSYVKPKSAAARLKNDLSTLDLATGVLLLVILSLLVANSYVAYLGKSYNERMCAESIGLAGKAANDGSATPQVQLAALAPWEHCGTGGFFIEQPMLVSFKDEPAPEGKLRVITISCTTKVRLPAPVLVLDKSKLDQDDEVFQHVTFKKTYQYKLTNPKNVPGSVIRTPDGRLIRAKGKSGPPDKKGTAGKSGAPDKSGAPAAKTDAPSDNQDHKPATKSTTPPPPKTLVKPNPSVR